MKKLSLLSACLLAGLTVSAQQAVVKDAEKAMKDGKSFDEVAQIMAPATQNPETKDQAITYYIPGKTAFKIYDDMLGKKQFGLLKEGDELVMAKDLLGGYEYFLKAVASDTVINEKGKVKTKYSKEIYNTLAGHYNDYNFAALDFWNAKDYKGAYKAWEIFLTMPENPNLAKQIKVYPDSTLSQVLYNQALAAWQSDDFAAAVKSFRGSIAKGNTKRDVFEYAVAVANNAKDEEAMLEFATKGNELYGKEDPSFINNIINVYIMKEDYDTALQKLDAAAVTDPDNAQYLALKGLIYTKKRDNATAEDLYRKALAIDADNSLANLYLGATILEKAGQIQDNFNDRSGGNFAKYKSENVDPLLRESVDYLEKAYKLDENNRSVCLTFLEQAYYILGDQAGMNSVKERKDAE